MIDPRKICQYKYWGTIWGSLLLNPKVLFRARLISSILLFLLVAHSGLLLGFPSVFKLPLLNSFLGFSKTDFWSETQSFVPYCIGKQAPNWILLIFYCISICVVFFTNKELGHHSFHCFHSAQYQLPYQLSSATVMLWDNHPELSE